MKVVSFSTSSKPYLSYSLPELKRFQLPLLHQCSLSVSLVKRSAQPLLRRLTQKQSSIKVVCYQKKEVAILEASSMDEIYDTLAERLVPTAAAASNPKLKYIVGLAGPPGAGKSTIASEVVKRVNKLWPQKASSFDSQLTPPYVAAVLPMDGFHLYRSQLDSMEDPKEAHARRGAPWTFSPQLLLKCLKKLRSEGSVYAPSFDHGVGDPVEDDIFVSIHHKVVIVEGNYLCLEDGLWKDISLTFDEKCHGILQTTFPILGDVALYWDLEVVDSFVHQFIKSCYDRFIDVDIETAMQRVLNRHISTEGKPPDVAQWRIDYNDRPNAELVMTSKEFADLVIKSIDL